MSLKKKLGFGIGSAALGLALIGGGTYAYFNDTAQTTSNFANGTLDLNAQPTTIIDVKNLKPGDTMLRSFQLQNNGTLDIGKVGLTTDYTVSDANGNNSEDLGKYIRVNFLFNADKGSVPVFSTTLDQLKTMTPDAVEGSIFGPIFGFEKGDVIKAGTSDTLYVQYEFVDNGKDQNQFQGDSLSLKWTFDGKQTAGEAK